MLDFLARKSAAMRASARWFALVITTQVFTSIATGIAIGYLLMFPIVLVFATCQPQESSEKNQPRNFAKTYVAAFDDRTPDEERCVDPGAVFWFTSLLGIGSTATALIFVTAMEHRRIAQDGGWAIGLAIGGRELAISVDRNERRLMNIVEEVAIAFATEPPAVLVLDGEPGINVFAAGLAPADSILCVTLGAIRQLDRDELQAVVAHEMSHLTNGDTRMGTRMTAILLGLQSIRVLAETLFSLGRHTSEHDPKSSISAYAMMIVGAAIWPMGLFGTIAATSLTFALGRCRETLADAEAVAKIRNPIALARAMRRILGYPGRGHMLHPMASMVAPMLFVERTRNHQWFSTHPPLEYRIAAVDPAGDCSPIYDEQSRRPSTYNERPYYAAILDQVLGGVSMSSQGIPTQPLDRNQIKAASLVVLSAVSVCDGESLLSDYEFMRGWSELNIGAAQRIAAADLSSDLLAHAIKSLASQSPIQRERMLVAIASTISGDAVMSSEEQMLLEEIRIAWSVGT